MEQGISLKTLADELYNLEEIYGAVETDYESYTMTYGTMMSWYCLTEK